MAKKKAIKESAVEHGETIAEPAGLPEGAVLRYQTGDTRVYQVGNATGDGSEGNPVQRIIVKVREVEEAE